MIQNRGKHQILTFEELEVAEGLSYLLSKGLRDAISVN